MFTSIRLIVTPHLDSIKSSRDWQHAFQIVSSTLRDKSFLSVALKVVHALIAHSKRFQAVSPSDPRSTVIISTIGFSSLHPTRPPQLKTVGGARQIKETGNKWMNILHTTSGRGRCISFHCEAVLPLNSVSGEGPLVFGWDLPICASCRATLRGYERALGPGRRVAVPVSGFCWCGSAMPTSEHRAQTGMDSI